MQAETLGSTPIKSESQAEKWAGRLVSRCKENRVTSAILNKYLAKEVKTLLLKEGLKVDIEPSVSKPYFFWVHCRQP